jgi:hypothetical protein
MKVMLLIVTVVFPNLQGHTNVMFARNGVIDLEVCKTKSIPAIVESYSKQIPYALDVFARCVIITKGKPFQPKKSKESKEEIQV